MISAFLLFPSPLYQHPIFSIVLSSPPLPTAGKILCESCWSVSYISYSGAYVNSAAMFSSAVGVRLYINNTVPPNYVMIRAEDIGRTTNTALWCQSALNESNIGTWLLPSGTAPPNSSADPGPLYTLHEPGQVALYRDGPIGDLQGVHRCNIRDNNTDHTLFVWIYQSFVFAANSMASKYYHV